jgi:lipopolysaccharide transport system permease protein
VFYPISALSENLQFWMWLNPLTTVIEGLRMTILANQEPNWGPLVVFTLISISTALSGIWFFHSTRKFFADVV